MTVEEGLDETGSRAVLGQGNLSGSWHFHISGTRDGSTISPECPSIETHADMCELVRIDYVG